MRIGASFLAALAILLVATPAWAWWEYAKWGMSLQQLIAASKGAVHQCGGTEECQPPFRDSAPSMVATNLQIARLPATALFDFDEGGKLRATFLIFRSKAIALLNDTLAATYGTPVDINNAWPARRTWRDTVKGTTIRSWYLPDSNKIIIEYRPATKGL